jgi:hypothetical protein
VSPRRAALVAAAAAALAAAPASAASLRTLHVDALSMRVDRARVAVGEVFHLAIHVRVRENVAALDELVVPDVGTMKLEGDERSVVSSPAGTDVTETLTLEPTAPGAFTFKPAYLDAIDARTRKPSRFSANAVRIVVDAAPSPIAPRDFGAMWRLLIAIAIAAGVVLVAVAALVAAVRLRRRRDAVQVTVAAPVAAAPPAPPRTPRDDVADALRAYRTAPAHDSLARLRGALFVAAGTTAGATLRDALAATSDGALRAALFAAERTAFGPAAERDAASAELVAAAQTWLAAVPAGIGR